MNSLLTPDVVPKFKPRQIYGSIIELRLVYPQGTTAACGLNLAREFAGVGEQERLARIPGVAVHHFIRT
jgi:hypothetical protein